MSNSVADRAKAFFQAGVRRADPYAAVVDGLKQVSTTDMTTCIAVGKAALRMMNAAIDSCGGFETAIVVTNYENAETFEGDLGNTQVFAAGHPVPDGNGIRAATAVMDAVRDADGSVLALISGGGSALLPAPIPPLDLEAKAAVNDLLLGCGADIVQMNTVRQHLSQIKGGGLLQIAAPNPVTALILSDVVGDDLRAIASGPTVGPLASRQEARALCETLNIWDHLPPSARTVLSAPHDEETLPKATNVLVGSNALSLSAMAQLDAAAHVYSKPLEGDVGQAAREVIKFANDAGTFLFGGETTVQIRGQGKGGRNQELALRVAKLAEAAGWQNWCYLQGGTDGRDGPTDAAGGLVDSHTIMKARTTGVDVDTCLENNDSYAVLKAADALLMTGATGTNVADLGVLIRQ